MTATFLLLAAAASSFTASAVRTMTPATAGEAVLDGREHGPVVAVAEEANPALRLPGNDRLELVQRPTRVPGGCQRRRWIAVFRTSSGGSILAAVLENVRPRLEVLATAAPSYAATG